jgi:hypothetical protein
MNLKKECLSYGSRRLTLYGAVAVLSIFRRTVYEI